MSSAAPLQSTSAKSPLVSKSSHAGLLLQRKCACGRSPSLTGECGDCNSKRLQKKLSIGASNDPLEREADRVADQLSAAPTDSTVSGTPPRIQRFTGQATGDAATAPPSVECVLSGSGRPLDAVRQQDMGQRLGHDFSQVRMHTAADAEQSTRDISVNAYTVGQNVVFGAGLFAQGSHEGRRLIAHVVQQSGIAGNSVGQSNGKRSLPPISTVIANVVQQSNSASKRNLPEQETGGQTGAETKHVETNEMKAKRGLGFELGMPADPSRLRENYFRGDHRQAVRIVQSNKGSGTPLKPRILLQMEKHLGHDFRGVRIHTDAFARRAAEHLDANAFTVQRDIFFGANMHALGQPGGIRRLAHELVHTIQQSEMGATPSRKQIHDLENQAEHAAARGIQGTAEVSVAGPCILREPTTPRAATGDDMTKEVQNILSLERDQESKDETTRLWSKVETNFPKAITAGSLARKIWTHLFFRHFVEPDQKADVVESAHPRYLFSRKYSWIDAQHFFGFIDFTEQFYFSNPKKRQKAFDKATRKGLEIEETQEKVRMHVVKPPPSTMSAPESGETFDERRTKILDESRQETVDRYSLLLALLPDPRKTNTIIEVFTLLNESQRDKFWIDMAKSAFTYEDFESNQLGIRFFFEHGEKINKLPEKDRQSAFVSHLGSFFKDIEVENDRKTLNKFAESLPGKERFNAPKTTEENVRKEHPDLFKLP